jgi:hypothetical protein
VLGLLADLPRKNCWTIALAALVIPPAMDKQHRLRWPWRRRHQPRAAEPTTKQQAASSHGHHEVRLEY